MHPLEYTVYACFSDHEMTPNCIDVKLHIFIFVHCPPVLTVKMFHFCP